MEHEPVQEVSVEAWHVRVWGRYKESWFDKHVRFSTGVSVLIFAVSVLASFLAIAYATERASNPVTDIILSNTPTFDVSAVMAAGTVLLIAFITILFLHHPKRIPFGLHTLSLFFFIRSAFTVSTHIASFPIPPQNVANFNYTVERFFFGFGGDLFFSA